MPPKQSDLLLLENTTLNNTNNVGFAAETSSTFTYGTSPPASPVNNDRWVLVDSITVPTYSWEFRYNSTSANTDKWEFLGGSPVVSSTANTTFNSTSYVDPGSVVTATVPRSGVYQVEYGAGHNDSGGARTTHASLKKGSAATSDSDSLNAAAVVNTWDGSRIQSISLSAADVVKIQWKISSAAAVTVRWQTLRVIPVRIS